MTTYAFDNCHVFKNRPKIQNKKSGKIKLNWRYNRTICNYLHLLIIIVIFVKTKTKIQWFDSFFHWSNEFDTILSESTNWRNHYQVTVGFVCNREYRQSFNGEIFGGLCATHWSPTMRRWSIFDVFFFTKIRVARKPNSIFFFHLVNEKFYLRLSL